MSEGIEREDQETAGEDRLLLLWRRIKHHRIAQWSVAYVALAYGIQHAIILTSESFEWPNAVARVSMLLLALGLPVVMTLAWYHGERASSRMSGAELTIITILLAMSSVLFYAFVRPSAEIATAPSEVQRAALATEGTTAKPSGVAAARSASLSPAPAISLAVLPFVNLSSDKEQEFFSDGMTEEITAALAKVPNLRVVGRTSAFQFKGENKDMRAIGQALSATHLIEGSVRKDGNQLRITAQLVKADDGTHVWTESYDRELKGIFAVQEEIAQAIAASLQVPLGLKQGETLVSNRTNDLESYQQYLRARAMYRARSGNPRQALEDITARDPSFAPAWGLWAVGYVGLASIEQGPLWTETQEEIRRRVQTRLEKGEEAARKALTLNPQLASGLAALAYIQGQRKNFAAAEDFYRQALTADPNDPETLERYGTMLANVGRLKESLRIMELVSSLEPLVPLYNAYTAEIMQLNGQDEASIRLLDRIPRDDEAAGDARAIMLARAYAGEGRFGEAADTLLLFPEVLSERRSAEAAAQLLRTAPAKTNPPKVLPELWDRVSFVYAYAGAPERVLEFPERALKVGIANGFAPRLLWHKSNAAVRKTVRFKQFVRDAGLVAYWKARGWPDLCHPVGADDFACE